MGAVDNSIPNIEVQKVWDRLESDDDTQLVDVRTQAEWVFVGLPDLSALNKETVLVEWERFPTGATDPEFAERLNAVLVS